MPFPWLQSRVPDSIRTRGPASHKRMHEDEVRQRAALLRRLGRDQATAVSRCMAHLGWGYEIAGEAPIGEAEVKALVAHVYR
ncbi:MAG: hypothetical protein ACOZNI_26370 [Myxococcota bacterium]